MILSQVIPKFCKNIDSLGVSPNTFLTVNTYKVILFYSLSSHYNMPKGSQISVLNVFGRNAALPETEGNKKLNSPKLSASRGFNGCRLSLKIIESEHIELITDSAYFYHYILFSLFPPYLYLFKISSREVFSLPSHPLPSACPLKSYPIHITSIMNNVKISSELMT